MGRDELFKMKKVGQPEPPPEYNWREVFTPLSKAFDEFGVTVSQVKEQLTAIPYVLDSEYKQEAQAEHLLREDVLLMQHEPGFTFP